MPGLNRIAHPTFLGALRCLYLQLVAETAACKNTPDLALQMALNKALAFEGYNSTLYATMPASTPTVWNFTARSNASPSKGDALPRAAQ